MLKEVVQGIVVGLVAIVCVVSLGSYIGASIDTHGGDHADHDQADGEHAPDEGGETHGQEGGDEKSH